MGTRTPPRIGARTMVTTFSTVVLILAAVFAVVTLVVRSRVRSSVIAHLDAEQKTLSSLEARRAFDMQAQADAFAESANIKAALDTYQAEFASSDAAGRRQLIATVQREVDELGERIHPDIVAVTTPDGQ